MESAHRYVDYLEELLPLVAEDAHLRAVLSYELGAPDEPIKLSRVADDAALAELRSAVNTSPTRSRPSREAKSPRA
jgi:hypothetical protein